MKKLLLFIAILFTNAAHAGPMANVEYIHKVVEQQWGITIPYNPELQNPKVAANMKYLLTAVDVANKMLNGRATTNYGNSEYATMYAADTIATNDAVKRLIKYEPKFLVTTTANTSSFSFKMSAAGTFTIDWGDGKVEKIVRTDTTQNTYSHTYDTGGSYKIGISGTATGYSTDMFTAAISFSKGDDFDIKPNPDITKIEGSLGAIFPTISNGQQPNFVATFAACTGLTEIPAGLFSGISGAPADYMFAFTFTGCSGLTGSIPEDLFTGVAGAPATAMFYETFAGCTGLTGGIPVKLFAGIKGAPADGMFEGTFNSCGNLTGSIPENLFAGIEGAPALEMFAGTFQDCTKLTGAIPEKLFAGIKGAPAEGMFGHTFGGCTGLTKIPANLFAGVTGAPATAMFVYTFEDTQIDTIPENLFSGIKGAPATAMFQATFYNCNKLTEIPEKLFAGISGAPAENMFALTFAGCSALTGPIPENLFSGINSTLAHPAVNAFWKTFYDCSNLSGCIPDGLFAGIDADMSTFITESDTFTGTKITQEYCSVVTPKLSLTTKPNTTNFAFMTSAAGRFFVDWGDGKTEIINRTDTNMGQYYHIYDTPGKYTIKLGGRATEYIANIQGLENSLLDEMLAKLAPVSTIIFGEGVTAIDGSLGEIFPTIGDGSQPGQQPRFMGTFYMSGNDFTGTIPENLFSGVHGQPVSYMFTGTFGYAHVSGTIPQNLFAGITGTPTEGLFMATFYETNLTGAIPANLFAGIQGAPAPYLFSFTFAFSDKLTSVPENLFAGIQGAPAKNMFETTFAATGITSIPGNLFAGISGAPAEAMFKGTFAECAALSGCIPDGLFAGIDENIVTLIINNMPFENTDVAPTYCSTPAKFYATMQGTSEDSWSIAGFSMSAKGNFTVDWGDGTIETISRTDTEPQEYTHLYETPGLYVVGIDGQATEYSTTNAAISFGWATLQINGSLGAIFSTIGDGSAPGQQPLFKGTFYEVPISYIPSNLFTGVTGAPVKDMFSETFAFSDVTSIPENLFAGISGAPADSMFYWTFYYCPGLTGPIPEKLFAGIQGAPAPHMFNETFVGTGINDIPENLFAGIKGAPAPYMFHSTFRSCHNLNSIPENLFAGIKGAPAYGMFSWTFNDCTNLYGKIPENLFGNISGPAADQMFFGTFIDSSGLYGPSAKINGQYLYEIWPDATYSQVGGCYTNVTRLSDYDDIPDAWK